MTTEQSTRDEIRALANATEGYLFGAYLSSSLTNLSSNDKQTVTAQLERLFKEVFHPLRVFLYLPHIWSDPIHDSGIPAEEVHMIDRLRIAEADFLVLCADHPSFGAGQELEIAQAMGMPALIYRRAGTKTSRMLLGAPSIHVRPGEAAHRQSQSIIDYADFDDLRDQLRLRVEELLRAIPRPSLPRPRLEFGARLRRLLQEQGLSAEQLADRCGLSVSFVRHLLTERLDLTKILTDRGLPPLREELAVTKYLNPGLWVLRTIGAALGVGLEDLTGEGVVAATAAARRDAMQRLERQFRAFASTDRLLFREYLALLEDRELLEAANLLVDDRALAARCRARLEKLREAEERPSLFEG